MKNLPFRVTCLSKWHWGLRSLFRCALVMTQFQLPTILCLWKGWFLSGRNTYSKFTFQALRFIFRHTRLLREYGIESSCCWSATIAELWSVNSKPSIFAARSIVCANTGEIIANLKIIVGYWWVADIFNNLQFFGFLLCLMTFFQLE